MTAGAAALTELAAGRLAGLGVLAGPESGKAGPLGLLVILLLGVATYLLIRSMNRHLRKVPPSFDRPDRPGRPGRPGRRSRRARPDRSDETDKHPNPDGR